MSRNPAEHPQTVEGRPTPAINFLRKRVEDGLPLYQGDVDSALAEARLPLLEEIGRLNRVIREGATR